MADRAKDTTAQDYQVRHAAAAVVSALSTAVEAAAGTLFVTMLLGWWVSGWGGGTYDFPGQWLYLLLPLVAAAIALRFTEPQVLEGRRV